MHISQKVKSALKFQSLFEITTFYEDHDNLSKIKENKIIQKKNCFKDVSSN